MNSQFKFKLLQHLSAKKANKGFTLIELLVVVIIIGILAAIALPNLLSQAGKARESEAKTNIGALNRAQQGYYTEYSSFATQLTTLEVPIGNTKYYSFSLPAAGVALASNTTTALTPGNTNQKDGTRDYVGTTAYDTSKRSFSTQVCRATLSAAYDLSGASAIAGMTANTSYGDGAGASATCPNNSVPIR